MRLAFVGEDGVLPEQATITTAKKNDRTQMESLINEPGITYVFDRGYVDDKAFDSYSNQGIYFVTRLKKNAIIETLPHELVHPTKKTKPPRVPSTALTEVGNC